jgi:hypothetical protein
MITKEQIIRAHLKKGNLKIGRDTIIFNMGPAACCPSKARSLCQLDDPLKCYAYKVEWFRPAVLLYRLRQEHLWLEESAETWARAITKYSGMGALCQYVRFNESGDFYYQSDVEKLKKLAKLCPGLIFYGFTARKDLSFTKLPPNLIINGSGWRRKNTNMFKVVTRYSNKHPICQGNCRICNRCKEKQTTITEQLLH